MIYENDTKNARGHTYRTGPRPSRRSQVSRERHDLIETTAPLSPVVELPPEPAVGVVVGVVVGDVVVVFPAQFPAPSHASLTVSGSLSSQGVPAAENGAVHPTAPHTPGRWHCDTAVEHLSSAGHPTAHSGHGLASPRHDATAAATPVGSGLEG